MLPKIMDPTDHTNRVENGPPAPEVAAPPAVAFGERRSAAVATFSWLRDLFFSVIIAIVVILFVYQPVKVEGTSMEPRLVSDERIFINKFVYNQFVYDAINRVTPHKFADRLGLGEIRRGDTVVFWFPRDTTKSYIKRVIGIPGDTVEIREGTVFVNGRELVEDYVPPDYRDALSRSPIVVPPGEYYVLGDHRSASNDSRFWETVPRADIYGKAVFAYWPLDRAGVLR